jgi:transaldolase
MSGTEGQSRLHSMTLTTPTEFWNDSCSVGELSYAMENGATGGTSNPIIVGQVLKKELETWKPRIVEIVNQNPTASEEAVAWKVMEEITVKASKMLKPVFDKNNGRNGRLSIQVNGQNYKNTRAMVEQALHFNSLYPNNNIKLPVTRAGLEAIEELSFRGLSVNATISFTVAQSVAVAEAVERGVERRKKEGEDISTMSPVCTVMVGRLDDWLRIIMNKKGIVTNPGYIEWAGVAAAKKAYRIYKERGYRTRLLNAAYRNHFHWSEFIGGDMSMTIPYEWQKKFNASDVEVKPRINDPVDPAIITELEKKFPDFRKAYDEKGMRPDEFEHYGATRRTLLSFISGYADFLALIRSIMISDPDIKGE